MLGSLYALARNEKAVSDATIESVSSLYLLSVVISPTLFIYCMMQLLHLKVQNIPSNIFLVEVFLSTIYF